MTTWVRYTTASPAARDRPLDYVELGPDVPGLDRRLIGDVQGKRVLDLGCGMGHGAVALARRGAKVFAVDADGAQITQARELAEREQVKIELHRNDLADLAFLRNASIDLVISVFALAAVDDLDRVFRQVHRVLHPGASFIVSLPHPLSVLIHQASDGSLRMARRFRDRTPIGEGSSLTYPHQIGDLHAGLARANFRVDVLLEPESTSGPWRSPLTGWVPSTLVLRARKEGI
jgi:2-polyprenyl-3-methyl-5-hydroxy-6-metoxy-1,4-benzoquinol methylase